MERMTSKHMVNNRIYFLGNETIINNNKNLIFAEDKASLYLQKKKLLKLINNRIIRE